MKLSILAGSTSQSINVFIQDSTSTVGAGKTGLLFNTASLTAYYSFAGTNATSVAITLATLAAVNSAYSSGGFKELDATNMPGWYRLDIPNAALATAKGRSVAIHLRGATGMADCPIEIELTGWDNQDAVRGGMSSLPNAAANANGGLPILSSSGTTLAYTVSTVTTLTNLPAITTDWITAAGVSAAAVTKIQSGLATPTNITAATGIVLASGTHTGAVIPTVTTLTNLPAITTDWLTGTGVAASAVTKIQAGLATPTNITAGTITTVSGNVTGSVGSVVGAVVLPSIPANWITAAGIATDAIDADSIATDAISEIQSGLSTLTAANVRSAVGLASANLDSQLATIASYIDTEIGSIISSLSTVSTNVSTILGQTGTTGVVLASGSITAAVIATDAIDADAIKTDAIAEIQSGLSTLTAAGVRSAVGLASANLDTQLSDILTAAGSGGGLDAAGVRSAIGLSSANLDTQLGTIDTNVDSILSNVTTNLDATVSSRLAPTVSGRTLDVTATGEAGIDWGNVGNPTTAVALSATTISTGQTIGAVSGAVGSVTANVSLPSIPAGWITAAGIAADAIGASELADSATAAIADRFLLRNLMGGLDGGRTVQQALFFLRNRWENPGGNLTVYATDDSTVSWTSVTITTPSDPVTSSNPA